MKEKLMDTQCKHHRIVIDCDGDTTRVSVVIDGREIKKTIARQTPEGKSGREVKRYANPGEYIRIVNAEDKKKIIATAIFCWSRNITRISVTVG